MSLSGLIANRFEIRGREPVAGGMSSVFRGHDRETGKLVAVKVLADADDPRNIERFRREAALLAALSHPGIVKYIAHGATDEGRHFLVMEWVDGEPLGERQERTGFTAAQAIALVRGIADALGEAHRHGVVHRDLKPTNILFRGPRDEVTLIDFGIARRPADPKRLTSDGGTIGTPGYMSPEQAAGEREVTAASDVFALGCILYECLTGRPAFVGRTLAGSLAKILMGAASPVTHLCPELPAEIDPLLERMFEKVPAARPADAHAVVAALDALPPMPTTKRRRRRRGTEIPTRPETTKAAFGESQCCLFTSLACDEAPSLDDTLRALAARHAGRLAVLQDGMVIVASEAPTAERVPRMAQLALELRAVLPLAPIVITTGPFGVTGEDGIDRGVHTLQKSLREMIFSGRMRGAPTPEAISVDDATADELDGKYRLARTKAGCFLLGSA